MHDTYADLLWREAQVIRRLRYGDIIGRLATASWCIPQPTVSEAHAMLSVRLHERLGEMNIALLPLRGAIVHLGVGTRDQPVWLHAGQSLRLADGVTLDVIQVSMDTEEWVARWGEVEVPLRGEYFTLREDGAIVAGVVTGRPTLFRDAHGITVQHQAHSVHLKAGDLLDVAGRPLRLLQRPVRAAATDVAPGVPAGETLVQVRRDEVLVLAARADPLVLPRRRRPGALLAGFERLLRQKLAVSGDLSDPTARIGYLEIADEVLPEPDGEVLPEPDGEVDETIAKARATNNVRTNYIPSLRDALEAAHHQRLLITDHGAKHGGLGHLEGVRFRRT